MFNMFQGIFAWHEIFVNTDVSPIPGNESRSKLNIKTNGNTNLDLQALRK